MLSVAAHPKQTVEWAAGMLQIANTPSPLRSERLTLYLVNWTHEHMDRIQWAAWVDSFYRTKLILLQKLFYVIFIIKCSCLSCNMSDRRLWLNKKPWSTKQANVLLCYILSDLKMLYRDSWAYPVCMCV